jgi:serine/threonine-protein kinase
MAADNETRYLDENEPVSEPLITPEQMSLVVDNKSFLVDCIQKGYGVRSDIYAVGATLYHLLTGVKPSINFFGIKPIHEFRDVVSPEFAAVIETCMRIDPDERYTDIDELKTALDNVYI